MGFVVLGVCGCLVLGEPGGANSHAANMALNGAVLQMFNHGLSAAGMSSWSGCCMTGRTPVT